MNITITCKQCSKKFEHGTMGDDMRGKRTKKLCDECKVEKKRIESKLYQRDLRLSQPSRPKKNNTINANKRQTTRIHTPTVFLQPCKTIHN